MRGCWLVLVLVLSSACAVFARLPIVERAAGRTLQQKCARIPNCQRCFFGKNDESITVLLCRLCAPGYWPSEGGTSCGLPDCAPGYYSISGVCTVCPKGSYCPGGSTNMTSCGQGLNTLVTSARSIDQCVTKPGFGFSKSVTLEANGNVTVNVSAAPCPQNFFNPGSNSLPCRRCPGGLLTSPGTVGATNVKACKAGPGYYFDKLTAKPCPRGTYKDVMSMATSCSKCPLGLTTAASASTSIMNCTQALPGYKVESAGMMAAPCDRGTYNAGYNEVIACTPCEEGMVTLSTGATAESACLAPPGFGFEPEGEPGKRVQICPENSYKSGFNRQGCRSCGFGFLSEAGSDTQQKCYVPKAHGTIKITNTETAVVKCKDGLYGFPEDMYGAFDLPCRACAAGMKTWDAMPGLSGVEIETVDNMEPSDCWTLPGYGYDSRAQASVLCAKGTYNPGWNKEPCMPCGEGYTTLYEGAEASSACVIAPGWYWDLTAQQVVPCDLGFYCGGAVDSVFLAAATPCPSGTTTREEGASNITDCDVCQGGFGNWTLDMEGPTCRACPADTFGPKGSVSPCTKCLSGQVAAPGSDGAGDCHNEWQQLYKDYDFLPVSANLSMFNSSATTETDCQEACKNSTFNCAFYQFAKSSRSCLLYNTPAVANGVEVGLKIDVGVYSVFPGGLEADKIGAAIGAALTNKTSVRDCARACDQVEGCVAVAVYVTPSGSYTCTLKSGALSDDVRSQYKVAGASIGGWSL